MVDINPTMEASLQLADYRILDDYEVFYFPNFVTVSVCSLSTPRCLNLLHPRVKKKTTLVARYLIIIGFWHLT